ncbi:variable surface protein [Plasmodium gonderi]|uniref:Variable surface protein n=1 Tax=Plasmodium gonderi TaxID=77519 RepID=A0A1Y1JNU9_PLAGO|nr:variable surface protein [Plasmodium gonderi]GAW84266.1 variable surface protein [Plasmodium gonderi]
MSSEMGVSVFGHLHILFSKYKNIMYQLKSQNKLKYRDDDCNNTNNTFVNDADSYAKDYICPYAMECISYIHNYSEDKLEKEHLIYLYYLIYLYFQKTGKNRSYVKELYHELLKVYNGRNNYIPYIYVYKIYMLENELKILTGICDLNVILNDIKTSTFKYCEDSNICNCSNKCYEIYLSLQNACGSYNVHPFCNILKTLREQYNSISNLTENCLNIKCKTIPCDKNDNIYLSFSRTNYAAIIILSTIVMLLTPILLFVLYNVNYKYNMMKGIYNSFLKRSEVSRGIVVMIYIIILSNFIIKYIISIKYFS